MSLLGVILAPWTDHPHELKELRLSMASTKDMVARLKAATDELANDLKAAQERIANQDSELASELDPIVTRLEEMGRDPQNPVPSSDGSQDAPEGDTDRNAVDGNPSEVSPEDVPEQNA